MARFGLGFGVAGPASLARRATPMSLDELSLDNSAIAENSAAGTLVGNLVGVTNGSTLTLLDNAGGLFALDGGALEVAGAIDFETAASHQATVREERSGATNTPRDTLLTIQVTNLLEVTLQALALSVSAVNENVAVGTTVGTVQNRTNGATLTLTANAGGRFSLEDGAIKVASALDYTAAASHQITLRETHADSANSPRDTVITITVNDVAGYDASAAALIARMTTPPDETRAALITTLISTLKQEGVWAKLDVLYVTAAHTAQAARLNWTRNAHDATALNSPAFTTDRGYTGDGSSAYLNTNYNPASNAITYGLNNSHLGVWSGTNSVAGTACEMGNTRSRLYSKTTAGNNTITQANASSANTTTSAAFTTSIGHVSWSRNNSTSYQTMKNGVVTDTFTQATSSILSTPFFLLAFNTSAAAANPRLRTH